MCFSPQADVATGLIVGVIAVDAARHVRRPAEKLLVAVPIVLATHSLIEAVVWWGIRDLVATAIWRAALWAYLVIAFGVLPVLVPLAVAALEPVTNRRRAAWFVVIGAVVAVVLVFAVVRGPVEATIEGDHISYVVQLWNDGVLVVFYVIATCGSLVLSKQPPVRLFGVANFGAVCVLAWLDRSSLISLWCFWAAATSVAIALHLRATTLPVHRAPAVGS